jgi:hypothetical protein
MKKLLTIIMLCGVCYGYAQNTPPHAASTRTWVITANGVTQTWSDHINLPECNKPDFDGGSVVMPKADCMHNRGRYYFYSWPYVIHHAKKLCPAPWRIPTKNDFVIVANSSQRWGGSRDGIYLNATSVKNWLDMYGYYWSASAVDSHWGWHLRWPERELQKRPLCDGMAVRCVR